MWSWFRWFRIAGVSLLVGGVAVTLWATGLTPLAALAAVRHAQSMTDTLGPDAVAATVAALACWALLGWLGFGVVVIAAGRMPGAVGRVAERMAAVAVPLALRRLLAVGLGASLVGGLGAGTALASEPGRSTTQQTVTGLNLDWPITGRSIPQHATADRGAHGRTAHPGGRKRFVVVRPGDSLWSIAAHELPHGADDARIAANWPRWYAANRHVIGDDPGRILPGQRLAAPGAD